MYNILICDDEQDIINALKIYLSNPEYSFFEAANGRMALEAVEQNDIHLILVDHEPLPQELRDKVYEHVYEGYKVLVPAKVLGKIVTAPGRKRGEDEVIHKHQEHSPGHVCVTSEGEFTVEGKVPENTEGERYQI